MKCNNRYCYWQGFNQCLHESEEGHKNATPNMLGCPSSLRVDFEDWIYRLAASIRIKSSELNFNELIKVNNYMDRLMKGKNYGTSKN